MKRNRYRTHHSPSIIILPSAHLALHRSPVPYICLPLPTAKSGVEFGFGGVTLHEAWVDDAIGK